VTTDRAQAPPPTGPNNTSNCLRKTPASRPAPSDASGTSAHGANVVVIKRRNRDQRP